MTGCRDTVQGRSKAWAGFPRAIPRGGGVSNPVNLTAASTIEGASGSDRFKSNSVLKRATTAFAPSGPPLAQAPWCAGRHRQHPRWSAGFAAVLRTTIALMVNFVGFTPAATISDSTSKPRLQAPGSMRSFGRQDEQRGVLKARLQRPTLPLA